MDPFEEFEFKPLTNGLGFQKNNKPGVSASTLSMDEVPADRSSTTRAAPGLDRALNDGQQASGNQSKRPTHSKNITDIISSLPSLDLFEEGNRVDENGSMVVTQQEALKSPLMETKTVAAPAKLQKPFGGKLDAGSTSIGLNPKRPSFSTPRPGSPTVPGVAAIAEMAAAASTDIMGPSRSPVKGPSIPPLGKAPTPQPAHSVQAPAAIVSQVRPAIGRGADSVVPKAGENTQAAISQPQAEAIVKLQPSAGNLVAMILDGIMITGFALLFLVALLLVTKINLPILVNNFRSDMMTQLAAGLLLFSVQQVYLILSRSFYGCTLGEWAFDLQLGTPEQQARSMYPILVAWRSFVVLAFGVLLIPLLSMLAGRDLAYYLCGLQMQKKV